MVGNTAATEPTRLTIDQDSREFRYYRNAVERHWDPGAIDLEADREALSETLPIILDGLKESLAKFGAGEQAVTEDLAPLGVVLEDIEDQMFVTTQLYEESKHTDFFDRYWREVVHPAEEALGLERSSPTDPQWFDEHYDELFARNEQAMERLLTEDTPENRARAYCHYHLTIEGILAQTGYYGLTSVFGDVDNGLPHLPGLVEGINGIRSDEGRHVGFGMAKLKHLVEEEGVDPALISDVTDDLIELIQASLRPDYESEEERELSEAALEEDELTTYAAEKHLERLEQITNVDASIPDVDELTSVES